MPFEISPHRQRRHDIDALRALAFGLLILYHVGMFYVAGWDYHLKSAYEAQWLKIPMLISNQWRMPLIFLISGLAVSFVWGRRTPIAFAARRIWRLLIPLLFGMAVICAPQAYFEAVSKGAIEPGFWRFMGQYLTMRDFPADSWSGVEIITWTWTHLWYLPYLLAYTLVLIPLALFLDGPGRMIGRSFRRLRGVWLIVVPTLPLFAYGNFVYPSFPHINHALLDDWYAHAMYFTFFLYGYLLANDRGIWAELAKIRRVTLALAMLSFALYYTVSNVLAEDTLPDQLEMAVLYLNRWLWIVMILGWGHHLLNRPFRWLPYATEAVYPWYILHQTLTLAVGYHLSGLALGPVAEPFLVLAGTFGGCFLIHEFVIRRTPLLRPLFGLSYRPKPAASPNAPAAEVNVACR